jgi:CotH kinase protein
MSGQGIHRAFRRRIALVGVACLGLLAIVPASSAADEIEWMYDPGAVVEIRLGDISGAELDALELEPDEYVHGSFELRVDGERKGPLLADVGIRLKGGFGSARPVKTRKSGFKVRFDEFDGPQFFGIKRLTLNNMVQDPSMVHETMTYELFRALGVPAPRTGYAFIRVNGAPYGVYLNIETYDEVMLPRLFATTRHLYEADAAGVDVRSGEEGTFEVDEGDDDLSDLEALIAAANDTVGDWSDGVEAVADLDEMTRMWAVERYAGHWDGYAGRYEDPLPEGPFRPNNYYLHSLEGGVFAMLPWGTDQTWDVPLEFDEEAGGLLFNNCFADASCRELYEAQLEEVAAVIPGLELDQVAVCTAELLAPWQAQENQSRAEYHAAQIAEGVEDTRSFMALRLAELADYLGVEPPADVPDGTDPCLRPDPEKPIQVHPIAMPPPEAPPATTAKIGKLRRKGPVVLTNLHVTGSAIATLRVFTRIDGKRRGLCADRAERVGAGRLIVRCRLPEWGLKRLVDGPLELKARVGFFPQVGTSRTTIRGLTAPRR